MENRRSNQQLKNQRLGSYFHRARDDSDLEQFKEGSTYFRIARNKDRRSVCIKQLVLSQCFPRTGWMFYGQVVLHAHVPGALSICTTPILGPKLKYTIKVGKLLYVAPLRLGHRVRKLWSTGDQGPTIQQI